MTGYQRKKYYIYKFITYLTYLSAILAYNEYLH